MKAKNLRLAHALTQCRVLAEPLPERKSRFSEKRIERMAELELERVRAEIQSTKDAKRERQRKIQVNGNRRRSRVKAAEGSFTREEWIALCHSYAGRCAYCHQRVNRLTVDHVIPLSKGGSNCIANIRPACGSCNSSKGARDYPARGGVRPLDGGASKDSHAYSISLRNSK